MQKTSEDKWLFVEFNLRRNTTFVSSVRSLAPDANPWKINPTLWLYLPWLDSSWLLVIKNTNVIVERFRAQENSAWRYIFWTILINAQEFLI